MRKFCLQLVLLIASNANLQLKAKKKNTADPNRRVVILFLIIREFRRSSRQITQVDVSDGLLA